MKLAMTKVRKADHRQSGQAVLESLMLLSIIVAVWVTITAALKNSDFFGKVWGHPWARLSNEIEFGIPTNDNKMAGSKHPTSWARHSTYSEGGQ